ncbi:sensor histidine kinase [Odoribacter lunatus]|uniref:sensor histidine kinase n=1 Tax=Odoribacter lunatus TaxID=2941335 RepID=UPI00203C45E6|nr:HAMP domain-containing sensor histidine kinase [Odoribacter lunatus]
MKKALIVFIGGVLLLGGLLWGEYRMDRQAVEGRIERLEKRLHEKEREADQILAGLADDSTGIDKCDLADVVFLGFRKGEIFFWTNEVVGMDGLYDRLIAHENFIKINNAFYEVRRVRDGEVEYFALLHIKDSYPYTNKYIKNRFGKFLNIGRENTDNIQVSRFLSDGSQSIRDKDGRILCYIKYNENYKDRSVNYLFLGFYLLVFFSFFYVFNRLLKHARSLKRQLLVIVCFVLFLAGVGCVAIYCRFPASLYRLYIFDNSVSFVGGGMSIGDLLLFVFSVIQLIYLSFVNLKINYQSLQVRKARYMVAVFLWVLSFFYLLFLNYAIRSLIANAGVHLNMAQIVYLDTSSVIAFVIIVMMGLGLVVIIDGTVGILKNLFSFGRLLLSETLVFAVFIILMFCLDEYINMWGCVFVLGIFVWTTFNRYKMRKDVQRSGYMLTMLLLSVYVVLVCKKYEQYRELTQRLSFSTELIEERDSNFENKLREVTEQINDSEVLADLVANYNEEFLEMCLTNDLLELNGYNYVSEITLCRAEDSLQIDAGNIQGCHEYFEQYLREKGVKIQGTAFYAINNFDGIISYIGVFVFGDVTLYLSFNSTPDTEGRGYPQILSRKLVEKGGMFYLYSYAKYKDGQLIYSSGDFNYYKSLERLSAFNKNVRVVRKDGYSHMLIPVEEEKVLVMSLRDRVFSFYNLNILYAFFVCMLLSSYGVCFTLNQNIDFKKGTLKARIKYSILFLIFFLFVTFTALSIYLNMRSFEDRHNEKALELLKYINKEIERLDCVDYQKCSEIRELLTGMSQILEVDINIYTAQGMLVATSRPEIFQLGFDGYLIDAEALEQIARRGLMSYVNQKRVGELEYISAYMPLLLENGETYILNVPYFTQNDELNMDIVIMVIIAINIAVMVIVLAFALSGIIADQVMKPLQLLHNQLKEIRLGGKNEKIDYNRKDEMGGLVREYNNMVVKLEESAGQLARFERESAWREMARQIAHDVKNPLTPMKLNIQFMLRSLQIEDSAEFKKRFKEISGVLMEQIDNMASIASAFSDFAKIPVSQSETFDISEVVVNCVKLFENNVKYWECDIEPGIQVFADKEQIRRVFVNILKNAEQSFVEGREGKIKVSVKREGEKVVVRIRDNGSGIPEAIWDKIFEPNFTTKNSGMGLGLAISRRIVESMGGKIGFTTSEEGTEFYIILGCESFSEH